MFSFPRKNWLIFGLLLGLIVSSNALIYRLEIMQPLPKEIVIGSLFDFIIVIPLITYFYIIRKRFSIKYVITMVIIGYFSAYLIIPNELLSSYSFIKYILFLCEGIVIFFELYILLILLKKLPAIIRQFQLNSENLPYFQNRLEQATFKELKYSRIVDIFLTEFTILYYSIFSWKKKTSTNNEQAFTYHKKTSAVALYIMLIHALILESVGFHFLIHSWNSILSYIVLGLNVYTLLFVVAEIQAIRLCPFLITDRKFHIQVGIMKRLTVDVKDIKSINYYSGPEKLSKNEQKMILDAVMTDFVKEKPMFEIEFFTPKVVHLVYGFKQRVLKVHLRPEPQQFYEALSKKLTENNVGIKKRSHILASYVNFVL